MKRFIKKGLSIAIVLVLILACSVNVLAEGIEPRWKELSTFSCRLDKQSGLFTNANLSSHAASWHSANTINLTVTIQKWNGSSYVNTSYSWSNSGKGSASVDKSMSLSIILHTQSLRYMTEMALMWKLLQKILPK